MSEKLVLAKTIDLSGVKISALFLKCVPDQTMYQNMIFRNSLEFGKKELVIIISYTLIV